MDSKWSKPPKLLYVLYTFLILHLLIPHTSFQSRAWAPEPGVFGSLEPEPLEKKNQMPEPLGKKSGAGASKKLAGSSALLKDKKHKEIVNLLLFFR